MVVIGEKPWVRYQNESDTYGRFILEPLERGFGTTLGNSMRRVLLSSLPGAAITSIKIAGAPHEFSTIDGVKEDVLQIILNIKELTIKSYSDTPKVIKLKAKGKGEVTAEALEHDAEVEIINKDHVIATLDPSGKLDIEMVVERGKGFVPSERNKKPSLSVGSIPIDSIFTPILKVNVTTEEVRVGQEINYDRLILDVWTNGAMKPEEAVVESAKIMARHVDLFVHLGQKSDVLGISVPGKEESAESVMDMSIDDLELSARSSNCLRKAGIKTVGEIMKYSVEEMLKFKNFGLKSLNEVREKLAEYKIQLKETKQEAGNE